MCPCSGFYPVAPRLCPSGWASSCVAVATEMQVLIKASGVNPVSQLEVTDHIPASDVAQAVAYLCGPAAAKYVGEDFHIKSPESRAAIGLTIR